MDFHSAKHYDTWEHNLQTFVAQGEATKDRKTHPTNRIL
jgi:hypothetical protein